MKYVNREDRKPLVKHIWDKKYLQPITDIIELIISNHKNKKEYIQEILTLREVVVECNKKMIDYCIADEDDLCFLRLIEESISDDLRFLIFNLYGDIIKRHSEINVPNCIVLEYAVLRKGYIEKNIIGENDGLDIDEMDYMFNTLLPHPSHKDISDYLWDKHYPIVRHYIHSYLVDETLSQYIVNSIYDYQSEYIEMCRIGLDVGDSVVYTHPDTEFEVYLLKDVAKNVLPLFEEILILDLKPLTT